MRRSLGLYRRPSGIYAVRISVPKRLQSKIGKLEIHASTGYRDSNSAIIVAHKIQLFYREYLMSLDAELVTKANPLLQTPGIIYLNDAANLIGLGINNLLLEFSNQNRPLFVTVNSLEGYEVEDIYALERDDGYFVLNDVESKGFLRKYSGILKFYDSKLTIASLIEKGKTAESTFRIGSSGGFFTEDSIVRVS